MTLQEIFYKVLAHSRQMTEQSYEDKICKYLCENGTKCFVGVLIPEELHVGNIENFAVCNSAVQDILSIIGIVGFLAELMVLQNIHDHYFKEREEKLKQFAIEHNLNYTPNE